MNKNVIIVILIIIVLAVLGAIVFSQLNASTDTQINFLSGNALNSGDNITFELKDVHGNVLPNQMLNITYKKDDQIQTFSVVTDSEGKGYLTLVNEEDGVCEVTVNFEGADNYNPSNATQTITIGEATSETYEEPSQEPTESTSSDAQAQSSNSTESSTSSDSDSSNPSNLNYDEELNVEYDDNGVIRGGQNDGQSYKELKDNPQQVDENGNLI